ncbi:MAG: amino acid adenylation domain-containing protein, partial [Cyclobacteriaceae bacterium]
MIEVAKLLRDLKKKGVGLNVSGEDLEVTLFNDNIEEDVFNLIREKKPDIIRYIKSLNVGFQNKQIPNVSLSESYPISDAQRRLWVLSQFDAGNSAYNLHGQTSLDREIDIENFKKAIKFTIARHEILRTVFKEDENGEIKQWIANLDDIEYTIDYKDFRNKKEKARSYILSDSQKAFDLKHGPLIRMALLHVGESEYIFYFNMHHIIGDGWSIEVLSKDVLDFYNAYQENKEPNPEELRIQYKDYSAWQLSQLSDASFDAHKNYWLNHLAGELPVIDLPSNKVRPNIKTSSGQNLSVYLDENTSNNLKSYCSKNGGSLFMGLLASWAVLIYRYTSQEDIIIGTPVAGREHEDLENQIGFYVNSLPLRHKIDPDKSFDATFQELKESTLEGYSHQMYPFDRLVEELNLHRNPSRNAVFDMMLILQNQIEKPLEYDLANFPTDQIKDNGSIATKFDLEITFQEVGTYLSFDISYNTDIYDRDMVEGLIRHYEQLLIALLELPEKKVSEICYLSENEKHNLLTEFNDSGVEYPENETIVGLFDKQTLQNPHAIAVIFEEKELSYQEINNRSNQLARYLKENYDIKTDDLISIKQDRSEWFIISIMGVLKSGGAYVPIDPTYPSERIKFIEKDTNSKVCLDNEELYKFEKVRDTYSKEMTDFDVRASSLAYVIYTSGSTGIPKGVLIDHKAILNTLFFQMDQFRADETTKGLQFASFSFDASIWEIFVMLLSGGRLYVCNESHRRNPELLISYIRSNDIGFATLSPSYFSKMEVDKLSCLNTVITAGEAAHLDQAFAFIKYGDYYNAYGPTETSICATIFKLNDSEPLLSKSIPIGKPIANAQIYIVNDQMQLQPVGVVGEICIGGNGLARGYLNQDLLTEEKFVRNPFKEGERLYKTGDLGRWLSDGNIEFIGRKDDQVKIRGFRIEPGEIEQALLQHPYIEHVAIVSKKNNDKINELVAYFTSDEALNVKSIKSFLGESLPEYMVPSCYVQLDELPLTSSDKVDKKSLPDPAEMELASGVEYVAPRNETEEKLVLIWEEVLQKKTIGIDFGFFDAGGNSISLVSLRTKIEKEFKVNCSLTKLFEFSTIRQQVAMLLNEDTSENANSETYDSSLNPDEKDSDTDIAVIG